MLNMLGRLYTPNFFHSGGTAMEYTVIRSRRKTVAIQITPAGEVLVRCPKFMLPGEVRRFVQSKASWIEAHLSRLPAPQPKLTEAELRALATQAKEDLPKRAARFAPLVGIRYGRITIRSQKSRWGSCSAKGNLNFNCLLMLAPPEVRDYVVVHELCHRKELNHSPAFWAQVERILPDYRIQKQWLKDHGTALIARLP